MTKREKLRRKLRNRPADGNMQDVRTLLERFGFVLARVRGSHHIFEYDDGETVQQIIMPLHGRKVKKVYIRQAIAILDFLFPPEQEDDNGDED